jgi:SAM-dependent methyltransferase
MVRVSDWSDDDALWEAMAPALAAPERFALAEADAAAIAAAVNLPPGAAVLDIGCGAGVHALAFAARGYAVTGIDRSELLLRIAESHRDALPVSFRRADMRDFVRPASFDLACSLYSSFGYFDEATNARVLANARESLRPRGTLIVDVLGRAREWPEHGSYEISGTRYAVRRRVAGDTLFEEWTVGEKTFPTRQRLFTPEELRALLLAAGFTRVDVAASLDGRTAYEEEGRRLVGFGRDA